MNFFIRQEEINYPSTQSELFATILEDSKNNKPRAISFFQHYFDNGGNQNHPILGDLDALRRLIQKDWDYVLHGVNSVAAILESRLKTLNATSNAL